MNENDISYKIIGTAIDIHRNIGPGLLESAYEACLVYELEQLGLSVECQKPLPLVYKENRLVHGYRLDLFVDEQVVVELKVVENLSSIHEAQILSYLKLSGYSVALLINFNVSLLKHGIRRFAMTQKR